MNNSDFYYIDLKSCSNETYVLFDDIDNSKGILTRLYEMYYRKRANFQE